MDKKMKKSYLVWKNGELSRHFLKNIRRAVPMSGEQLEVMLRVIEGGMPDVKNFLDLGCGDGALGRLILSKYPSAQGLLLDLSEQMIGDARQMCKEYAGRTGFILEDLNRNTWADNIRKDFPFDVIVSGFAIHHLTDRRKKQLYREIFGLLRPGGIFLNIEHVSSSTDWLESVWDNLFIDSLYDFHRAATPGKSREEVASSYHNRLDKEANILAPVEAQCKWLRNSGYVDVDCYFKLFELAVFGGRRPG
ncbi:MAG TPA: class I SAM-dependent methyltransferase [Syntrophales bacterium]|nr:class I SAM-dependent methyltransferase [Syntrophales bacterium]